MDLVKFILRNQHQLNLSDLNRYLNKTYPYVHKIIGEPSRKFPPEEEKKIRAYFKNLAIKLTEAGHQ